MHGLLKGGGGRETHTHTHRQTDRQTDRQTETERPRQTDRQTERQRERQRQRDKDGDEGGWGGGGYIHEHSNRYHKQLLDSTDHDADYQQRITCTRAADAGRENVEGANFWGGQRP